MPTTPQAYVGRKAIKYGARYGGRYAARKARRLGASVISREQPPGGMRPFLAGLAAGALIAWLLDPRRRARHEHAVNVAQGVAAGATAPLRPVSADEPDDVTLTRKVQSEIFRAPDAPKGQVSVNAEAGVVYLRGEVDSTDTIGRLVRDAEGVRGVQTVQSLLHLPGTPAPSKDDLPGPEDAVERRA